MKKPVHVAIIMDGNGRWARERRHPRFCGHVRGSHRVSEVIEQANDMGIAALTLVVLTHLAIPAANLLPRFDTWMSRFFKAYGENADSIDNAQAINAELAIHNGGYFGVGVGSGKLKQYLPEAYADFYYSSFVEEFGLLFAVILIFLYLILFYRILRIGLNAEKLFETYVCVGIGLLILSQAMINMMVCTGIMPVTGQNMPFLAM